MKAKGWCCGGAKVLNKGKNSCHARQSTYAVGEVRTHALFRTSGLKSDTLTTRSQRQAMLKQFGQNIFINVLREDGKRHPSPQEGTAGQPLDTFLFSYHPALTIEHGFSSHRHSFCSYSVDPIDRLQPHCTERPLYRRAKRWSTWLLSSHRAVAHIHVCSLHVAASSHN